MSRKTFAQMLKEIEEQRQQLIPAFLETSPLIVGSITQTKGRCGKPNCACAEHPTHEITLLMSSEGKKRISQLIRKDDMEEVLNQWEQYKTLRQHLSTLKELNQKELAILKELIQYRKRTYK